MNLPNYAPFDYSNQDSNAIASILSAIQSGTSVVTTSNCSGTLNTLPTQTQANGSWANSTFPFPNQSKFGSPKFNMSFYQSENGGFIMELKDGLDSNYVPKSKLFIIKEIENMGTEIQNILLQEILKG
jgi:hypothetical protein